MYLRGHSSKFGHTFPKHTKGAIWEKGANQWQSDEDSPIHHHQVTVAMMCVKKPNVCP